MKIAEVVLPTMDRNGYLIIESTLNVNQFGDVVESCKFASREMVKTNDKL